VSGRSRSPAFQTTSRKRIFTCRPTSAAEEASCANEIRKLRTAAYRGPLSAQDIDGLTKFYAQGRGRDFESGIRMALRAMLTSPRFLFRLENRRRRRG
jgi:hypothetical protein